MYLILSYLMFKSYFLLSFYTVTSKNVCLNIRNVKLDDVNLFVFQNYVLMNWIVMAAVCVLFIVQLRWPKKKIIYDIVSINIKGVLKGLWVIFWK